MSKVSNLSTALTILARAEAAEHFMHADVAAFGAPSECHALVARGQHARNRIARKRAEAAARAPLRVIKRVAQQRGGLCPSASPKWQRFVGIVYQRTYPF
jgi:hypothetical protein